MAGTIFRPGIHNVHVGGGVRIEQPGAAVVPWYLSGGIAAANCLAAYTPKGALNLTASYDNNAAPGNGLADGTYDAAPGVAPTWAVGTGWTFNGNTQYLTTAILPPGNATWSFMIRFSGLTASGILFGQSKAGVCGHNIEVDVADAVYYQNGQTDWPRVPPDLAAGILGMGGTRAYRNGIDEGIALTIWAGVGYQLYVGCRDANTIPANFVAADIQAFAVYNTVLTAPRVLAVSNAMSLL